MTTLVYLRPPDEPEAICTICVIDEEAETYVQVTSGQLWNLIQDAMNYADGHMRRLENSQI